MGQEVRTRLVIDEPILVGLEMRSYAGVETRAGPARVGDCRGTYQGSADSQAAALTHPRISSTGSLEFRRSSGQSFVVRLR